MITRVHNQPPAYLSVGLGSNAGAKKSSPAFDEAL